MAGMPGMQNLSRVQLAEAEIMSVAEMFNKMNNTCWNKCITSVKEEDLNVGEMSCSDRCVGKYLEAHQLVGEMMQKLQQPPQ